MSQPHNVLGLDVGGRRVGVALASLEAGLASPLVTIDVQKQDDIFNYIVELAKKHEAGTIIIGLPRGMESQETAQTQIARDFAKDLAQVYHGIIELQDEAGTSIAAEEELQAKGKPYEKGDIDKLAATIILRDWLETAKARS